MYMRESMHEEHTCRTECNSASSKTGSGIEGVDGIVLVTRWKEFQQVPELLKKVNPYAVLVDGRRMLDKRLITHYEGIGL